MASRSGGGRQRLCRGQPGRLGARQKGVGSIRTNDHRPWIYPVLDLERSAYTVRVSTRRIRLPRRDQDPFVYQTSPQQYSDEPSASPQITWAMPVEPIAIPK
jgi:hypothetical protein